MLPQQRSRLDVPSRLAPETKAYINAMSVKPSGIQIKILDARIKYMKNAGTLQKLYGLFMYDIHDPVAALINTVNPAGSPALANNMNYDAASAIHSYYGSDTLAEGRYINLQINPSLLAGASKDSFAVFAWSLTESAANTAIMGCSDGVRIIDLWPRYPGTPVKTRGTITGSNPATVDFINSTGLFGISRLEAAKVIINKDGVQLGNPANASNGLPNANIYMGGWNNNGVLANTSARKMRLGGVGKGLSDADFLNIYTAINLNPMSY